MKNIQRKDASIEQVFEKIPPEIFETFTYEQLEAIKRAFDFRSWNRHCLDIRVSVPIPRLQFYMVFLAGQELRSQKRRQITKSVFPLWTPTNIVFLSGLFIVLLISAYTIFSLVSSSVMYLTSPSFYPTSIPWLTNKVDCEHSGRTWSDGKCWDSEHNPLF